MNHHQPTTHQARLRRSAARLVGVILAAIAVTGAAGSAAMACPIAGASSAQTALQLRVPVGYHSAQSRRFKADRPAPSLKCPTPDPASCYR
jgi:hypothetical protein